MSNKSNKNETKENEIKELQQLNNEVFGTVGLFYMYLARPILRKFGKKGEIAVRKGLRKYGAFRGEQIRKWHLEEKIPINMESLQRFWDNGYAFMYLNDKIAKGALFSPYDVRQSDFTCPAQDYWKAEDWTQFGYMYCDEIHQELTRAYHPKGVAEIHENLNKGDPKCQFIFIMPSEGPVDKSVYDKLMKTIEKDPVTFTMNTLKKTIRMVGTIYYFLAKAIIEDLGDEGKKALVSAMRELGKKRGEMIRDKILKNGKKVTLENVMEFFDLPYNRAWTMSAKENVVIKYCPLAEVWKELGDKELGALYCNVMYKAMFNALSIKAKVSECIMCGSDKCTIRKAIKKEPN